MIQVYLFPITLITLIVIVARRRGLYARHQKAQFKKKIRQRVQELKKTAHREVLKRFKEQHQKEQKKKRVDVGEYKMQIKKAELAISKQDWAKAKQILIHAISLNRNDVAAEVKLALVYQQEGELNKAENLYRRLLEETEDRADIHSNLGRILTRKKNYKEAIAAYARAVDLDPKDAVSLVALGKLYVLLGKAENAIECLRQATRLKPREVQYWFLIARTCMDRNDEKEALAAYEKILAIEPYNEKAKELARELNMRLHEQEPTRHS